ncbi:MAG: transposase [Halobacteria archaeon]|nr:transposase [Halobacteria archaeon]
MSREVTKTLEVKLFDPNTHKREKFRETYKEYQKALNDTFTSDCSTQSEANDVVVEYDLSGYAKNALKKYVPQLVRDGTQELDDGHPVRFTNEGIRIDHKPQNALEWYVKIPHHEDYHLWCPVTINPEQRDWIEALHNDGAELGEVRMFPRGDEWHLHLTAHREVEETDVSEVRQSSIDYNRNQRFLESCTPIGVDIGETALATVCHLDECGSPTAPKIFSDEGSKVRQLREEYFTTSRRLQERGSEKLLEERGDEIWRRIDDIIHTVTRRVVEYAERFEDSALVLEDLTHIRENMDYGAYMNRRLHGWAFAQIHAQIRYKAEEKGIPVETVNPKNTSKRCHACGEEGTRPHQATFRCTNDDCWVSEYQADVNGATNIALRYLHGESLWQKTGGDDSVEDGTELTQPQDTPTEGETHPTTLENDAS